MKIKLALSICTFILGLLILIASNNIYPIYAEVEVTVNPGDDVESIIESSPEGASILIKAGLYRISDAITPNAGQIITGEYGAIISGTRILNGFVQDGSYYSLSNQTDSPDTHGSCENEYPRCNHKHDLFIDNVRLVHVDSIDKVDSNNWFYDYDLDKIYIGTNPTGKLVELASTDYAFQANLGDQNNNVTIRNLVIEKFSNWAQRGVIRGSIAGTQYKATGWIVENNEIRYNHGSGISFSDNWIVRNNLVTYNGQLGIGGTGVDALVEGNEISFNNDLNYERGWEGGGTKFAFTQNLVVKNNYVHDNNGPGLWTDIDNINTTYDGNTVVDNFGEGIKHEISFDVVIKNNFLKNNGGGFNAWTWGSQIHIQNSRNAEVYNNFVIKGNGDGIGITQQNRGYANIIPLGTCDDSDQTTRVATCYEYLSINNNVYNNFIYDLTSNNNVAAIVKDTDVISDEEYFSQNLFDYNQYYLNDITDNTFGIWNSDGDFSRFQSYGQELNGSIYEAGAIINTPEWNVEVGPLSFVEEPTGLTVYPEGSVYRFYNLRTRNTHFYTSDVEVATLVYENSLPGGLWPGIFLQEEPTFSAVDQIDNSCENGSKEVYRYLNKEIGDTHFYAITDTEINLLEGIFSDTFIYEGVEFCAYESQVEGSIPVYRWVNRSIGSTHFYTSSEEERNYVNNNLKDAFEYEGISFYALPFLSN